MSYCHYQALRAETKQQLLLGLWLRTVIPVALSAEIYPLIKKSLSTGKREIQLVKSGGPLLLRLGPWAFRPCMWDIETCRQILQRLSAADLEALETYAQSVEEVAP